MTPKTFSEEPEYHAATFRHRLLALRKQSGYSRQALANLIGCHVRSVEEWEAGRVDPTLTKVLQLCKALRCMPNDLCLSLTQPTNQAIV